MSTLEAQPESGKVVSFEKQAGIPRKSIYRLSIYQRCLQKLKDNHIETVSSEALARAAGVKPTQLRKDLAYFGQFGTRGLGYNVINLESILDGVLGTNRLQPVILVGAGNLGSSLLRYQGFNKEGFEILSAFDVEPDRASRTGSNSQVLPMSALASFVQQNKVRMAILTVPANYAQQVTNQIVEAGILAILNFSATVLDVPDHVVVSNVDLAVELENLSYFIK